MSLHLGCVYGSTELAKWFHSEWAKTGKKLDMGKACIRFRKLDDLALDVIGETLRRVSAKKFIAYYESAIMNSRKRTAKPAAKTATKKKTRGEKKGAGKK